MSGVGLAGLHVGTGGQGRVQLAADRQAVAVGGVGGGGERAGCVLSGELAGGHRLCEAGRRLQQCRRDRLQQPRVRHVHHHAAGCRVVRVVHLVAGGRASRQVGRRRLPQVLALRPDRVQARPHARADRLHAARQRRQATLVVRRGTPDVVGVGHRGGRLAVERLDGAVEAVTAQLRCARHGVRRVVPTAARHRLVVRLTLHLLLVRLVCNRRQSASQPQHTDGQHTDTDTQAMDTARPTDGRAQLAILYMSYD